jgi:Ca-activated chloride channel family protein
LAAIVVVVLAIAAELLHARRIQRVAVLAFGPAGRPAPWAWSAPLLRVAGLGAACWGLVTLMLLTPKVHAAKTLKESEYRHVVLVLDVSPSMRLDDAGPKGDQQRMKRASEVMDSFFKRVAIEQYRISVIAVYNGAKPVVVDTKDVEVVRNILGDLPMHHAFPAGKTDIFSGLEEAAKIAHPWKPRSTTVILVSDGDTVPATGMPKMPASVAHVLIVGIGDPRTGKFIDGRQSRQDASTLRQVAARLSGTYHNGNEKHLSTELLRQLTESSTAGPLDRLSRREYALIACGVGSAVFALLPLLLHYAGTRWRPGVPVAVEGAPVRGNGHRKQRVAKIVS